MEIKSKVFRRKSGKSVGKWVVRIEYFDDTRGKRRCVERHADRRSDAIDIRNVLTEQVKKTRGKITTGLKMTFNDLADECEKEFYKPAVIVEGLKIEGVRSLVTALAQLKILREYFGTQLINDISTESLYNYRGWRLAKISSRTGKTVKLATTNREISAMRKMLNFAFRKRWIVDPVFLGSVIDAAAEVERTRLLTKDEEERLLNSCDGERLVSYSRVRGGKTENIVAKISVENPHLKAMIILALDSAMRRGELFKLRWQDIDFDNNQIKIIGTHTKTERPREVPLSKRAKAELLRIRPFSPGDNPFPLKDIKRSFATAKKIAGIEDLHFHDLRRTCITRWIAQGTPLPFAGKLAGHTQQQTTQKHYTAMDAAGVKDVGDRMDAYNEIAIDDSNELIN